MVVVDHLSHNVSQKESEVPTCSGLDLKINDVYLTEVMKDTFLWAKRLKRMKYW